MEGNWRVLFLNRIKELGDASGRKLSVNERSDEKGAYIVVNEDMHLNYNGVHKWVGQPVDMFKCWCDEGEIGNYDFINETYKRYFYEFDWYGWYDKLKQVKEK